MVSGNSRGAVEVLPEYEAVRRLVADGCPLVLVTGGAGTGKSTFIRWLDQQFAGQCILSAPTGIAALTIEGKTIHSLCKLPPAWIVRDDVRVNQKAQALLKKAKVLVIDEISMVNANLLDAVDLFFRLNREQSRPFGGISVVMVGDLFQLPPVVKRDVRPLFEATYSSPKFFAAHCIASSPIQRIDLTRAFRQVDQEFVNLLDSIRRGSHIEESIRRLNESALRTDEPPAGAVWLCPRNKDVERVNEIWLAKCPGPSRRYQSVLEGQFDDSILPVPANLELRVGAQVILANNTEHWNNGTIAVVHELGERSIKVALPNRPSLVEVFPHSWDRFDYDLSQVTGQIERKPIGRYTQLPVNLGWAMTIHKSQGITVGKVHLDLGQGAFEFGQTYVALSRCRTLTDISLAREIRSSDVLVDPESVAFHDLIPAWRR